MQEVGVHEINHHQENIDEFQNQLLQLLIKFKKKHKIPGLVLGWSINGHQDSISLGYADLTSKKKINMKDRFQIGNLTELFSSFYLLNKFKTPFDYRGKQLDLNSAVTGIIKTIDFQEYRWSTRNIEISNLLSHTSGLGEYRTLWDKYGRYNALRHTKHQNRPKLNTIYEKSSVSQIFSPKSQWYHSEHNYGIAGALIEKIENTPFPQLIEKDIFARLAYTSTSFDYDNANISILGYCISPKQKGKLILAPVEYSVPYPSSGMISTVEEVLLFLDLLIDDYQLEHEDYDPYYDKEPITVFYPAYSQHDSLAKIGFPFILRNESPLIAEYSSFCFGISSKVMILPEYGLSILFMVNRDQVDAIHSLVDSMLILFCDLLNLDIPEFLDYSSFTKVNFSSTQNGFDTKTLDSISGYYRPSKTSTLLKKYQNYFGNDLFVSANVSSRKEYLDIALMSTNIHSNQEKISWSGGRKILYRYKQLKNGKLFLYKSNGRILRAFFPKSTSLSSYMYLETPAPVVLYRRKDKSRLRKTITKLFADQWSFLFHDYIIPASKDTTKAINETPNLTRKLLAILAIYGFVIAKWLARNSIRLSQFIKNLFTQGYTKFKPSLIRLSNWLNSAFSRLWQGLSHLSSRSKEISKIAPSRISHFTIPIQMKGFRLLRNAFPLQFQKVDRHVRIQRGNYRKRKRRISSYKEEYYSHINFNGKSIDLIKLSTKTNCYRVQKYLIINYRKIYLNMRKIKRKLARVTNIILEG